MKYRILPLQWILLVVLIPITAISQQRSTLYAVVLGNQDSIVGSSTLGSGLFRSVDFARTWQHLGPRNLKAYAMDAVDRTNGQILFIAAGNGVHKSTDYGTTWRITTDWRMTEVMDVKVNQQDPRWVVAATAWGLWRSSDGGERWENPEGMLQHRYVFSISPPNSISTRWVALVSLDTSQYLYRCYSENNGASWDTVWDTIDTSRVRMYGKDELLDDHITFEKGNQKILYGFNGVAIQSNSNDRITDITSNLPTRRVHALIKIHETEELLAGTFGYGVWRKDIHDTAWQQSGLGKAQVWSLTEKQFRSDSIIFEKIVYPDSDSVPNVFSTQIPSSIHQFPAVSHSSPLLDSTLHQIARNNALNFQFVAAKLVTGTDTALAWRQLDTLLRQPKGDIFWMYPATCFYFYCHNFLDQQWRARFRETWRRYTPYRGDTENHFLMYYSSLFLFSQEWPDLPESEWFNGKSSRQIHAEATAYLNHWIDETVTNGMSEWDSPRYHYYYIAPLLVLRDFASDSLLRHRCQMMLEFLLADAATEYLNGNYCGAHSRDGESSTLNPRLAEMNGYINFYLRDTVPIPFADLAFAAISPFRPSGIIREILNQRDAPFLHREVHRSRGKMRFSKERFTPVWKQTFINRDCAIGSMQGGLQSPIQQHTWDVTFAANRPNNTIFGLNPYSSAQELGMFFPEEPELMLENIGTTKAGYRSPDKWIGGSPFEQVWQHRGTLIARYDIPPQSPYPNVDLFFPKSLDTLVRDSSGWIICRMEGGMVGIWPFDATGVWSEQTANLRYRSGKGYVVETASTQELSFPDFIQQLRQRKPTPSSYTTIHGDHLTLRQQGGEGPQLLVNGVAEAPIREGLRMEGPFLECTSNGVVTLRAGREVESLDFSAGKR